MQVRKIKVQYTFDELVRDQWLTRSRTVAVPMECFEDDEATEAGTTSWRPWVRLPDGRTAWLAAPYRDRIHLGLVGMVHTGDDREAKLDRLRADALKKVAGVVIVGDRTAKVAPLPWVRLTPTGELSEVEEDPAGIIYLTPAGLVAPLDQVEHVKTVCRMMDECVNEHELARWTTAEPAEAGFDLEQVNGFLYQVRVLNQAVGRFQETPSWEAVRALAEQAQDLLEEKTA